jgi:1-acyl-sn-glycerol-3-phosphate acyltransferase
LIFTRLGLPKLWGEDPERVWPFGRLVVIPIMRGLAPTAGYGLDRVPLQGGGVVAANHFSGIDHPLIGGYCPRTIYFLAKAELFEIPVVSDLLTWIGTFPVRRGEGDREALRQARRHVAEGKLVGVHVEGTRQRLGHPGPVQTGGLMIALQERALVIPCAVDTFRWSPTNRRPCAVVWGEPLDLSELPRNRVGYGRAAELVGAELVRLWRLAVEAAAADLPEELSDGAKRYGPVFRHWSPSRDGGSAR